MDFRIGSIFYLFVLSSLLCSQSRAEDTASVFFIDSSTRQFLRTPSSNDVVQPDSMLPSEVGAAVSVLLGFSPPLTLSAAGSSKLNEVLKPNPFDRPRAVFILEVQGTDPKLVVNSNNAMFSSASERKVSFGLEKAADIQLPDENKVSVLSLDEPLADYTDKEIGEFASWMDGSYIADSLEPLNGDLTIPLADGANMNLHMSKKAERDFISRSKGFSVRPLVVEVRARARARTRKESAKIRNIRMQKKFNGTPTSPRLSVFCSDKQLYAMLVDDKNKKCLFYGSTLQKSIRQNPSCTTIEAAKLVGEELVKACNDLNINEISSYDRNGFACGERMQAFEIAISRHGFLPR